MMRRLLIYFKGVEAGVLTETQDGKYEFGYNDSYLLNRDCRPIALAFPKQKELFVSETLFPFFANMLSEGANKALQCATLKIDEDDAFGLLSATATFDTIGAVTVREL